MTRKKNPTQPPYRPRVGELVNDLTTGHDVVFMDSQGGLAYVRPVGGGVERALDPAAIKPLPGGPTLAVRVVPGAPRGRRRADEGAA
ncbi:hypothetical protein [Kitasatospora purpeofusca]|uniref:hypothetical protein n=1 Tax=Kitasatospora purpeofusca TaxID=67352 RepID=UPI0038686FAE|nr:hypothetical protein OIP63_13680 [Kitasatospora purpeofusca]